VERQSLADSLRERAPSAHRDQFRQDDVISARVSDGCTRGGSDIESIAAFREAHGIEVHALFTQCLKHRVATRRRSVREDTFPLEEYSVNHGDK
jgi:hypothetical protein